ncbi:glycosyltransferase 61 family protein [Ningiella sp. W23]|uniref:glycosyltransferase 61 family protein n=1 Tax=Ningiella sp. W23 TaxID=3023715 RepID=UPI003756727F
MKNLWQLVSKLTEPVTRHIRARTSTNSPQKPAKTRHIENATAFSKVKLMPYAQGSSPNRLIGGLILDNKPDYFDHWSYNPVASRVHKLVNVSELKPVDAETSFKSQRGHYFYGGPAFFNYGHFLAESIHRLRPLLSICETQKIKGVVFQPQVVRNQGGRLAEQLPPHFYDALAYLGIPKKKVVIQKTPCEFETLWVSPQESHFRSQKPISEEYRRFLCGREKAVGLDTSHHLPNKLYVSRKNYLTSGTYAGEAYVESVLKENGFFIFYPENHDLMTQLSHYKSARKIIISEGSAIHTMELLGSIKAEILVIQRRLQTFKFFAPLLEARAEKVQFFADVEVLPSLRTTKLSPAPLPCSALAVVNIDALAQILRNMFDIVGLDREEMQAQINKDIQCYFDQYAPTLRDTQAQSTYINSFITRCEALGLPLPKSTSLT